MKSQMASTQNLNLSCIVKKKTWTLGSSTYANALQSWLSQHLDRFLDICLDQFPTTMPLSKQLAVKDLQIDRKGKKQISSSKAANEVLLPFHQQWLT